MARFLVTGGAGFIGSHVASALLRRGETVRVLDNFSTGLRANLAAVEGAEVVEGDLRSYHIVMEAVAGVDFVLHQAALPSVPRSVRDPITSNDVNVVGTLNLLTASRDAGVKRLVYASSSSVYGRNPALPKDESMATSPISPYAVSKLAGEQYCQAFAELYGFPTVILRYFNVFGPRQNPKSEYAAVIPRFIQAAFEGESVTVYGDGQQTRDFTYVDNVVAANLLACERDQAVGQVFNVATNRQTSLLDLMASIERASGKHIRRTFAPARTGDVLHSCAAIGKAQELLGFEPLVDLEEGLRLMVARLLAGAA